MELDKTSLSFHNLLQEANCDIGFRMSDGKRKREEMELDTGNSRAKMKSPTL